MIDRPQYQSEVLLISPRVAPDQLNDDALGRTLDTLYTYSVTELYSLVAARAAKRLALSPTFGHLDTTSFHLDGRYTCDEPPPPRRWFVSPRPIAVTTGPISTKSCWNSSWSIRLGFPC